MQTRKKTLFKTICILLGMALIIVIYNCFLRFKLLKYSEAITAASFIVLLFITMILFGMPSDKNNYLKTVIRQNIITFIVFYFIGIYTLGVILGFLKNAYSLEIMSIFRNIVFPIILIICEELIRFIIISNNSKNKKIAVALAILITLTECMLQFRTFNFTDVVESFKFITKIFFPSLFKNLLLSYLTIYTGYKISLLYRLILDTYVFFMPIIPDLGDYFETVVNIVFPLYLFYKSSKIIDQYNNGIEHVFNTRTFKLSDIPLLACIIVLIYLISGFFPYYVLGIASPSMEPNIKKGDAVIIKKVSNDLPIKVGDVVVYNRDSKKIVHRVSRIENENGQAIYYTKGDANNSEDSKSLIYEEIEGKVLFRVPYVAIPSVYIREEVKEG